MNVRIALEIIAKTDQTGCFMPEVQFLPDAVFKHGDHNFIWLKGIVLGEIGFQQTGHLAKDLNIQINNFFYTRTLDFKDDLSAILQFAIMHLGHGCRGDGRIIKFKEEFFRWFSKFADEYLPDGFGFDKRSPVLKILQFNEQFFREQIGAIAGDLGKLDVRSAQFFADHPHPLIPGVFKDGFAMHMGHPSVGFRDKPVEGRMSDNIGKTVLDQYTDHRFISADQ